MSIRIESAFAKTVRMREAFSSKYRQSFVLGSIKFQVVLIKTVGYHFLR